MRTSWQEYMMGFAEHASTRSTCERLHVGAAIVIGKNVVATGYNGSVEGEPHCEDVGCMKDEQGRCIRTVHAERNALAQCAELGLSTKDAAIYVTHFPCLDCLKQIIRSGITHIYYRHPYANAHPYGYDLIQNRNIFCKQLT